MTLNSSRRLPSQRRLSEKRSRLQLFKKKIELWDNYLKISGGALLG